MGCILCKKPYVSGAAGFIQEERGGLTLMFCAACWEPPQHWDRGVNEYRRLEASDEPLA
jgi:hypothetical protein